MTQFVRVLFPRSRSVEIDNTISGLTNQVLMVEEGTHRFDLGQPLNYTPTFIDQIVTGTTPAAPMPITFTPAAAPMATDASLDSIAPEPAPAQAKRARKKAKKKAPAKRATTKKAKKAKKK